MYPKLKVRTRLGVQFGTESSRFTSDPVWQLKHRKTSTGKVDLPFKIKLIVCIARYTSCGLLSDSGYNVNASDGLIAANPILVCCNSFVLP